MNISSISFGRKIPRYTCQIQEKETGKYVPATIYEYDCKDEGDYLEVKSLGHNWCFRDNIAKCMDKKHTTQAYFHEKSNDSFFALQTGKDILGLIQVCTLNGISNIDYITTKPHNPYKYVGQTMIAAAGKRLLKKDGYQLTVETAIDDAAPFYKKIGFKEFGKFPFEIYRMNKNEIETLIEITELTTDAPILDKKA